MLLGKEVGLGPGDIVLDGDPAPPHGKGHSSPCPIFWPMSIVAKRSPISAIAEFLFDCDCRDTYHVKCMILGTLQSKYSSARVSSVIEELFNFNNIHNLNFLETQVLVLEYWVLVLVLAPEVLVRKRSCLRL